MLILAIETTGSLSSVALTDGEKIKQIINHDDYSHLQQIVPLVKKLLEDENKDPKALDAIAISRGPGSFTGIRIGMATAKGLAQVWNKSIVEVPTLATFAFRDYDFEDGSRRFLYCPVLDAKMHQVYAAGYLKENDDPVIPDAPYNIADFVDLLNDNKDKYDTAVFFGDGIAVYKEALENCGVDYLFAEGESLYQTAFGVAKLGCKLFNEGKLKDCFTAEPEYLRLPEAERKLKEKQENK